MPDSGPQSVADRTRGILTNVHPRRNGDLIPIPEDVMENRGDFVNIDASGNPEGLKIVRIENPDGWDALVGTTPNDTRQQNSSPLLITRPSFADDMPFVNGPPAPSPNDPLLAKIPQAQIPLLKAIKADMVGFPGTTPQKPLWYAYGWYNYARRTGPGPPVPFQVAQGQGVRVAWEKPPSNVEGVTLYVSEPGTTTATNPGILREQWTLLFNQYKLNTYDLTRYINGPPAPGINLSYLFPPSPPIVRIQPGGWTIGGEYHFYATQATPEGETLPSNAYNITIPSYVTGSHLEIYRPWYMSAGATGWYVYMQKHEDEAAGGKDAMGRLFWRTSRADHGAGEGRDYPIAIGPTPTSPFGHNSIPTSGDVTEGHGAYDVDVDSHALPTENTSGIPAPDSEPEIPLAFGASRPGPGQKYVRTVDRVGNRRSAASDVATINIASDEILRIIHRDHTNLLANGDNIELDANGLPLDHTVVLTGGTARVEGRELVLETLSAQSGTTPSDTLDSVPVDRTVEHAAWGWLKVRDPRSGTLAGSVEVVLRELNASNAATDTVLFTYTLAGDYEYHRTISPAGTSGSGVLAWQSGTVKAGLVIRFSGASKNMHARSYRVILKDHKHKFRLEGEPPDTEQHRPPGSQQQISLSPEVAPPPETFPFPTPDRLKLVGALREAVDFEPGMPAGWTQTTTGGGTIARSAGAALSGSFGLKLSDASTSSPNSRASFTKVFDSGGSHEAGLHRKIRPALLPNGKLTLGGIARPDGTLFIWPETGSLSESSTLTIDSSPTDAGNFTVVPDGASAAVAVVATKQVEQLSVSQAPTASGTIALNIGGTRYNIPTVGGAKEIVQLTLQAPRANGYLTINLGGIRYDIPVNVTDTAATAAEKVARTSFPGWTVEWRPPTGGYGGNTPASKLPVGGNTVTFTATAAGPRTDATYQRGTSGTPGSITPIQQGTADTAAELADRIAAMSFGPLWTVSHTPGSTTITLTAVQAGPKTAPSVDWGTTGANGTISTLTPGAVDSPSDLAARIRAATFTGWTVSGSGVQVILTANAAGFKRDLRIDPASTGVRYHFETTQQGKDADLTAHYKDDSGTIYSRRLMASLSSSTIYNVEATVEGAGTDNATIHFWGSTGSAAKDHLWRIENVSLVDYPAGMVDAGVSAEAAASETWEIHVDDIKVTDKGESYFEEYNDSGEKVGQFHHYGIPTQPLRDDIGIQEWREPCIPGLQYAISAQLRTDNVPIDAPAKPVFITAHFEDGSHKDIGDVTGLSGISGTHDWYEPPPTLIIPEPGCFELGYQSRNLSSGEIVVQRVVMSPGTVPKRTRVYATSGEYVATLPVATPYQAQNTEWGHLRRSMGIVGDVSDGGSLAAVYRSAQSIARLPIETYQSDPLTVPDRPVVGVKITFACDGTIDTLPVLKSGSPYAKYDLFLGGLPLPTLLRENGTEFDGGAIFAEIMMWTDPPEVAMDVASGLHLRPQLLSENAASLPTSPLWVFTQDAFREIVKEWYKPRVVETDEERLSVLLSAEPTWERIGQLHVVDGKKYSVWQIDLAWEEVLAREPLT